MNIDADIIECGSRDNWLKERRYTIGASESPAILGESPYASAMSVWADKTSPVIFNASTERQQLGLDLEPVVIAAYLRKFGGEVKAWKPYTIARSKSHPFMHATPDALTYEPSRQGPGVLQVKTWSEFDQKSWKETIPLHIQIQVNHEMFVTGCKWAVVAVLFGSSTLERYYIDYNEKFVTAMLGILADFATCIELRTPPAMDGSAATTKALARLHPNDSGLAVRLPEDADKWLSTLRRAKGLAKKLTQRADAVENQLRAAIGDNTYGVTPGGEWLSWKSQTRRAYSVSDSTFRVFRECSEPKAIQFLDDAKPQTLSEPANAAIART